MEFVSIQDVVGSLVPNVYVNKITLESSGESPSRIDPHIDDPNLEESISTGQETNKLKIRVDLTVKEAIINQEATWLKTQFSVDFADLLKINIKQHTNPEIYNSAQNTLNPDFTRSLSTNMTLSDANTFYEVDDSGNRIYSIPYEFNFELDNLSPQFLAYTYWMELDRSELANRLNQAVGSNSLGTNDLPVYRGDTLRRELVIKNGKVINKSYYYETEDGKIYTGRVHQMPNGDWMTGARHVPQNARKLNRIETNTSKVQDFRQVDRVQKRVIDLTRANEVIAGIPNIKRIRDANVQIKTSQKAFSNLFMSRDSRNNINGNFSIDFPLLIRNNTDFPALWTNNLTGPEALNRSSIKSIELKAVRLEGSPEAKSPVRYSSDDLNREPSKFIQENGIVEETIGIAHPVNNLIPSGQNDVMLQLNTEQVYVPTNGIIKPSTFMYAFRDMESPKKTDRYFQYKVVVEFKDGSVEYLEDILQDLELQKKNLEDYLFDASKLGTTIVKNPFSDPHIDPPFEGKDPTGNAIRSDNNDIRPGNFNVVSNRFTQEFIQRTISNRINVAIRILNPAQKIATYQSILTLLSSGETDLNFLDNSVLELRSTLQTYLNPNTGTITSIKTVISICDSLIESVSAAIKVVRDPRIGQGSTNLVGDASMGQNPNKDKIVKVEYTFPDIVSTNPVTNTGIDILEPIDQQSILRTVDTVEFNRLFDQEVKKIYDEQQFYLLYNGSEYGDQENAYTYFTPNHSYNYGPSTDSLDTSINPGLFRTVNTKSKFGRGTPTHYGSDATWLFQEYGLYTVGDNDPTVPFKLPFQQVNSPSQPANSLQDWQDAKRYSSRKFNNLGDSISVMSRDFPIYANQFNQQLVNEIESPQIDFTNFSPGTFNSPTAYRPQFLKLPPQLKGLILYKNNIAQASAVVGQTIFNQQVINTLNSEGEKDEEYYAIYEFKFTKIYEIEYFTGFGTTTIARGSTITSPATAVFNYNLSDNWQTLTKTVIDEVRQENKILFCRFKEYNNAELKVNNSPDESMPLVQRYFYFSPNGDLLEPQPPPPPSTNPAVGINIVSTGIV